MRRLWAWLVRSFREAFEPALSGAWDGGAGTAERRRQSVEHAVTRINDGWYVCDECDQSGSERWAILHQFPTAT